MKGTAYADKGWAAMQGGDLEFPMVQGVVRAAGEPGQPPMRSKLPRIRPSSVSVRLSGKPS